jgi:hypothetical protein
MDILLLYNKLANPAQRALKTLNIEKIENLSEFTKMQITVLHGIGSNTLETIEREIKKIKIHFKS